MPTSAVAGSKYYHDGIDDAVEWVRNGICSQNEAARRIGVSKATVWKACRAAGMRGITKAGRDAIVRGARKHCEFVRSERGRPDPDAVAAEKYRSGETYADLAGKYGVTRNWIAGACFRWRKRQRQQQGQQQAA